MSYSLSQLDAIGDVDPVAEADVYLAYGRDLQAEEILKEALRATPDRMAIRTKLLEVYAKRRDTKGYELLATQLFSLTSGTGEDWEKAQAMGREIDPDNALYQPGGAPDSTLDRNGGAVSEPLGASTMPQSVLPTPSAFGVVPSAALSAADDGVDLDLDLDNGSFKRESTTPALESFSFETAPTPTVAQAYYPGAPAVAAPVPSAPDFDLSDISLDLDSPAAPLPTGAVVDAAPDMVMDDEVDDPNVDPMARKLELAEEFRQIGDVEGARDLLQEVAAKADGALKAKAQSMLDELR
jgi:pilus assembly protein FimV